MCGLLLFNMVSIGVWGVFRKVGRLVCRGLSPGRADGRRHAERAEGDQERGGQRYRSVVDDEAQEKQLSPSYFPIDFDMIVE